MLEHGARYGQTVASSRQPHGAKARCPASFLRVLHLFCLAGLSGSSTLKCKISQLFRKALVTSLTLFSTGSRSLCCVVVSRSSRSFRTQRWRRTWHLPSPCTRSHTMCLTKTIFCFFVCVCLCHAPTYSFAPCLFTGAVIAGPSSKLSSSSKQSISESILLMIIVKKKKNSSLTH